MICRDSRPPLRGGNLYNSYSHITRAISYLIVSRTLRVYPSYTRILGSVSDPQVGHTAYTFSATYTANKSIVKRTPFSTSYRGQAKTLIIKRTISCNFKVLVNYLSLSNASSNIFFNLSKFIYHSCLKLFVFVVTVSSVIVFHRSIYALIFTN